MTASKKAKREATQLFRGSLVNGLLDEERAREVVRQIATTKPRGYLGILSHLRRLLRLEAARHTAKVESAKALPSDLQSQVKTGLTRVYGAGLGVSFAENPALIGGMRIQVGSDVYDGSVRSRLAALEQSF
jgi:F-type H+-transporting ATPase subunit delta